MTSTMVLIFLLLAIAVFAILSGVRQRGDQGRVLRERLSAIDRATERTPGQDLALLREEIASSIPALNRFLLQSAKISALQRWIDQAGLQLLAGKFLLASACIGGIGGVLAMHFTGSAVFGLIGFALAAGIPALFVSMKRQRRFAQFENGLPDAIDLMARAVRAGHAFTTCLELIASEMPQPLSGEFRKVFEEQKFGLPVREALLNLTERVSTLDVRILVTAILLQRETGGNLAEILDKLAYVIRERFKILRQVRVYTAQGRLTMAILLALPPGLAVIQSFISPDLMRLLFTDPVGKTLVITGLAMMIVGSLVIRKVIRIRV